MVAPKTPRRGRKIGSSQGAPSTTVAAVRAARKAVEALESVGAKFALIGGQAVAARTEPRFTEDVDLAVSVADDREAQQLVFTLTQRGWKMQSAVEQLAKRRLATVRLSAPGEKTDVLVDLLFASSGIEPETVAAATPMQLLEISALPVATVGHLIAMKVLSESKTRLQDRIDLEKLLAVATAFELATAEASLRLVSARGFARRKKLLAIFQRIRRRK